MGQVTVRVNGYSHTIGCKDGEEQHVQDLIAQIEEKVRVIRAMGGQFSESRMLLHVALLLADEANDLRIELARLRTQGAQAAAARMKQQGGGGAILNLCSLTSEVGVPTAVPYGSSKTGLLGMTRALSAGRCRARSACLTTLVENTGPSVERLTRLVTLPRENPWVSIQLWKPGSLCASTMRIMPSLSTLVRAGL